MRGTVTIITEEKEEYIEMSTAEPLEVYAVE